MSEEQSRPGTAAVIAMSVIVAALVAVAIYANWQKAHRERIESVTTTRFTPAPSTSPSRTP